MPQKYKKTPKPAAVQFPFRRGPFIAALLLTGVLTATAALAAVSSLPTPASAVAPPAAAATPAQVAPAPAPAVGKPFYAPMADKTVAEVTIRSAAFTRPGRLVLDTLWKAYVGTSTSDPAWFEVRDANGTRLTPVPAGDGALEAAPVTPSTPRSGLVAYDTAGPVTLVITDASRMQPTYITVKP